MLVEGVEVLVEGKEGVEVLVEEEVAVVEEKE